MCGVCLSSFVAARVFIQCLDHSVCSLTTSARPATPARTAGAQATAAAALVAAERTKDPEAAQRFASGARAWRAANPPGTPASLAAFRELSELQQAFVRDEARAPLRAVIAAGGTGVDPADSRRVAELARRTGYSEERVRQALAEQQAKSDGGYDASAPLRAVIAAGGSGVDPADSRSVAELARRTGHSEERVRQALAERRARHASGACWVRLS